MTEYLLSFATDFSLNMKLLTVLLSLISLSANAQVMQQDNKSLYIATYNIYTFGNNGNAQIYNAAKVLASGDFDLVAIQEVMQEKGQKAVDQMIVYLKDSFNLSYKAVVSPNIGQGLNGQERIAFVYKPDVIKLVQHNGKDIETIDAPNDGRDFAFTHWQKGNFTFVVGSGHLYYGDSKKKEATLKRRKQELEQVYGFFKDPKKQFGDEDLIFLGDFNRGALVADYKSVTYDTTKYFIPNVEFFDRSLNTHAQVEKAHILGKGIPKDNPKLVSTTVANGNTYVYDMIICSKSLLDNYHAPRNNGKFNTNFGVISYDEPQGIGTIKEAAKQTSHNKLKAAYSDHRPTWVRLEVL